MWFDVQGNIVQPLKEESCPLYRLELGISMLNELKQTQEEKYYVESENIFTSQRAKSTMLRVWEGRTTEIDQWVLIAWPG